MNLDTDHKYTPKEIQQAFDSAENGGAVLDVYASFRDLKNVNAQYLQRQASRRLLAVGEQSRAFNFLMLAEQAEQLDQQRQLLREQQNLMAEANTVAHDLRVVADEFGRSVGIFGQSRSQFEGDIHQLKSVIGGFGMHVDQFDQASRRMSRGF